MSVFRKSKLGPAGDVHNSQSSKSAFRGVCSAKTASDPSLASFYHNLNFVNPSAHLFRLPSVNKIPHRELRAKRAESRFPTIRSASSVDRRLESERRNNSAIGKNVSSVLKRTILERRADSWVMPSKVKDLCVRGENEPLFGVKRSRPQTNSPARSLWKRNFDQDCFPARHARVNPRVSHSKKEKATAETKDMMSILIEYWRLETQKPDSNEEETCPPTLTEAADQDLQQLKKSTEETIPKQRNFTEKEPEILVKEKKGKANPNKLIIKVILPSIADDIW